VSAPCPNRCADNRKPGGFRSVLTLEGSRNRERAANTKRKAPNVVAPEPSAFSWEVGYLEIPTKRKHRRRSLIPKKDPGAGPNGAGVFLSIKKERPVKRSPGRGTVPKAA